MLTSLYNKYSSSKSSIALLHTTDLHSHLIPSIDDGAQSMQECIEMIKKLKELGFKKLITTPHIMSHRFPNTRKSILMAYQQVIIELKKQHIDMELRIAAEYYYDEHFLELIDKKDLFTFGENHVLFEFSYRIKPFGLEETVQKLLRSGYKPVLAHPERYIFYKTKADYERLKEIGLLFQINSISTQGFYGKEAKESVELIIKNGMVDFIGSDVHNLKYIDAFSKSLNQKIYTKIMKSNFIMNNSL